MQNNTVHLDSIGKMLEIVNREYQNGELEGLIMIPAFKAGPFRVMVNKELRFLKTVGLLSAAEAEVNFKALQLEED